MKIVINKCYGGFGLSDEAMLLYASKKGITVYPEKSTIANIFWLEPKETRTNNNCMLWDGDIERNDPILIEVIEELGNKIASGSCAELEIIEVPDEISWKIDEYDGLEHVAEIHRTWG